MSIDTIIKFFKKPENIYPTNRWKLWDVIVLIRYFKMNISKSTSSKAVISIQYKYRNPELYKKKQCFFKLYYFYFTSELGSI